MASAAMGTSPPFGDSATPCENGTLQRVTPGCQGVSSAVHGVQGMKDQDRQVAG